MPIQFSPKWMDAVCIKGDWDVILERGPKGKLLGLLVYHIRKYRGFTLILMPPMTAYNGLFFFYPKGTKGHTKISYQNKVTEKLFDRLPKCSFYYQQYHPSYDNWLSLYWKGYKETTRYTYLMDKTIGEPVLRKNLKGNLRRNFKFIEEACTIEDLGFDSFWPNLQKSFEERGRPIPYNKTVMENLFEAFGQTKQLTVKACRHKETNALISGVVLASDETTTYYIASYYLPEATPKSSLGYVFWRSIFDSDTKICDFEGSMLKEVEYFLRAFGGQLTPHYKIWKIHNPLLRLGINLFKPRLFD